MVLVTRGSFAKYIRWFKRDIDFVDHAECKHRFACVRARAPTLENQFGFLNFPLCFSEKIGPRYPCWLGPIRCHLFWHTYVARTRSCVSHRRALWMNTLITRHYHYLKRKKVHFLDVKKFLQVITFYTWMTSNFLYEAFSYDIISTSQ